MSEQTSITLLERLKDGSDAEAWERFYEVYGPLIWRWLMRRGLSQLDADDIRQDVLQVALVQLPEFRHSGNIGALRCWLRQVVGNRLKTHWRQTNRGNRAAGGRDFGEMAEQLTDPDSELSRVWDQEYHQALCDQLLDLVQSEFQDHTMQAFRRVVIQGESATEVASQLGMSANSVRIAKSRVMRRLRELSEGMLD